MDKFRNQVLNYIREHELIRKGDAVTAGFSGGADSVCLLLVLHELSRLLGIRLQAVHVNHNLRGEEALRDEEFCRDLAASLGVPFTAVNVDVRGLVARTGMTEEEAGRVLRYQALEEQAAAFAKGRAVNTGSREGTAGSGTGSAKGRAVIAVAHHADDQAETILLNLLRGSGLKGLAGMRPLRDSIIRPLLSISRNEILAYLKERGMSYVEDSTNFENDHTRNFLRNQVLPELKASVNARAAEHIAAAGALIGEADAYLAEEAGRYLDSLEGPERGPEGISLRLGQTILKEKAQIFRRYVIIEALKRMDIPLKDWGEKHIKAIDDALFASKGYHADLPGEVRADNSYKETFLYKSEQGGN